MLDTLTYKCYIFNVTESRQRKSSAKEAAGFKATVRCAVGASGIHIFAAGQGKTLTVYRKPLGFRFLFGALIMGLKKFLKRLLEIKAQASLEYFILFSIIALLTIVSFSAFHQQIKDSMQGVWENNTCTQPGAFQKAAESIIAERIINGS